MKPQNKKQSSMSRALIIDNVSKHMVTRRVYPVANTAFPEDFVVFEPQPGDYLLYRVVNEDKVIERIKKDRIVNTILDWCQENWDAFPELLIEPETAKKIFLAWIARVKKFQGVPKSFEFAGGSSYVTHRCDFEPDLEADFSELDIHDKANKDRWPLVEFLSRCSSPMALAAFIGSIFYEKSYNQQYLVAWGNGNDGKGSVVRALEAILAQAYQSSSFEHMGRFWTSSFIGKRLVAFTDNNDQKAMQSSIWKQLTGGDAVPVEFKGETCFTANINAKYIITSNFAPVLKMDRADQRRVIVVKVEQIPGDLDPKVDARFRERDQLRFLVEYCTWAYRKLAISPDGVHMPIPVDASQVDLIENADDEIEQMLLEKFRFGPLYVCTAEAVFRILQNKHSYQKIARVLTRRFGCVRFRTSNSEIDLPNAIVRPVYYAGIGLGDWPGAHEDNERIYLKVKDSSAYRNAVSRVGQVLVKSRH